MNIIIIRRTQHNSAVVVLLFRDALMHGCNSDIALMVQAIPVLVGYTDTGCRSETERSGKAAGCEACLERLREGGRLVKQIPQLDHLVRIRHNLVAILYSQGNTATVPSYRPQLLSSNSSFYNHNISANVNGGQFQEKLLQGGFCSLILGTLNTMVYYVHRLCGLVFRVPG
jgi:hypothetical protein